MQSSSFPPGVEVEVSDRVATIWLARPKYRNAISRTMTEELEAAFADCERDPRVRVIVLRGRGPHFSSGHDLGTPQATVEDERVLGPGGRDGSRPPVAVQFADRFRYDVQSLLRLRDVQKPTIALVSGYCIYHGWALASAMDVIFVAEDAQILPTFVEHFDVPWQIGSRRAKELLFGGARFLTGSEAVQMGLASRAAPAGEELESAVYQYARRVAKQDGFTLLMMKQACNQVDSQQGYEAYVKGALSLWVNMAQSMPPMKAGQKSLIGKRAQAEARQRSKL